MKKLILLFSLLLLTGCGQNHDDSTNSSAHKNYGNPAIECLSATNTTPVCTEPTFRYVYNDDPSEADFLSQTVNGSNPIIIEFDLYNSETFTFSGTASIDVYYYNSGDATPVSHQTFSHDVSLASSEVKHYSSLLSAPTVSNTLGTAWVRVFDSNNNAVSPANLGFQIEH